MSFKCLVVVHISWRGHRMCPFVVVGKYGRYLRAPAAISPVRVLIFPLIISLINVAFAGLKRQWQSHLMHSLLDAIMYALSAYSLRTSCSFSSTRDVLPHCCKGEMVMNHNTIVSSKDPFNTVLSLYCTRHCSLSNTTVAPTFQNTPTDSRVMCASPVTMCALVIRSVSPGRFKLQLCIEYTVSHWAG